MRAYYSDSISNYRKQLSEQILGILTTNNQFDLTESQRNTWHFEINHMKDTMANFEGHILFEYTIPRMGKRVDIVLLINNIIFLLEYKHGAKDYSRSALDQVYDYALDLKNFHKESHDRWIVPIAVSTEAPDVDNQVNFHNKVAKPLRANEKISLL